MAKQSIVLAVALAASLCAAAGGCFAAAGPENARTALQKAQKTLGNPQSIQFSGTGMNGFFGQALTAGEPWPRRNLESVTESINYDQRSARMEFVFKEEVFQGKRQNAQVNGDRAWTARPNGVVPQPATAEERQLQIWMSPHGFVRAGLAAKDLSLKPQTEGGKTVNVVSFTVMGKYTLEGVIDASGHVTQVGTQFPNPVLGDMSYRFAYSNYRNFGGIEFPGRILQSEDNYPVNDFTVMSVKPNAAVDIPVPPEVQSAAVPVKVITSKLGDGVWFAGGGTHHSVIVEFRDFLAVIEAPQNEERSLAVMAQARMLAPNKPIRYVVNTHHHFDHAGGLRTYVAEGTTVVTHASNKAYWERSFAAPATLVPDAQSKARRQPKIQTVTDQGKYVITDGTQTIEVYGTTGDDHSRELLIAYIPSARVLVEADSFAGGSTTNSLADEQALARHIERLKLAPATIAGIHGSGPVPFEEFNKDLARAR